MAELLKEGFSERGYRFFLDSPTNQQFLILKKAEYERLKEQVGFSFWEQLDDDHVIVRFATSWATKETDLQKLWGILDAKQL